MNRLKHVTERLPWDFIGPTPVKQIDDLWRELMDTISGDLLKQEWSTDNSFDFLDYEPFEGAVYNHLKLHL
jgi:hypothetical protein